MRAEGEDWLALVEKLQKGDRAALVRLSSLIIGHLSRFNAYQYRDSWEDVCQEVLIKISRSAREGAIRDPHAFVGYVGSITRNAMIDTIRKESKHRATDDSRDSEQAQRKLDLLEADHATHRSLDLLVDLKRAVAELPEAQRRAVSTIYIEGYSYEEAAARVGLPLGTLKRHQTQGLRELRAKMGIEGNNV